MKTQISAKYFFLNVGAIAAFYASILALIILLFRVINFAFPQTNGFYGGTSSISFQVATLIVAFPLYLYLSWVMQKIYVAEPTLKDSTLRRWLAYITLFLAGAVLAGDLITVIYTYLDGRDLTQGFLLKFLVLLVIAGGVFTYYLREIRNHISKNERNVWRVASSLIVIASIILGFTVVGSPAMQRSIRYDQERVSDLQNIQWQVVNFYQQKGYIPSELSELDDSISGFSAPTDPETGKSYGYTLIGQSAKAFELCATFDSESSSMGDTSIVRAPIKDVSESWDHESGEACFKRAIDPQLYPVRGL